MTAVALVCAVLTVAFGLAFAGDRGPGGVDQAAAAAVSGLPDGLSHVLVLPTEPYVLLPVLALLVFWCLRTRRPWDAVFVASGPLFAVVNTWLLKPLFDRWKGDTLVYPSGHTVSLVATLVVVLVVTRRRTLTVAVGATLLTGATVGMIDLGYHYLTDIVGGTFFAVSATLGLLTVFRRRQIFTKMRIDQ